MIKSYKKLFEPTYGDVLPEVIIEPPGMIDFENPQGWRDVNEPAVTEYLHGFWKQINIYPKLAAIEAVNTSFERDGAKIPVRIYKPAKEQESYAVLIFYHGGAFCMNDANLYDDFYRAIAYLENVLVVCPDYRLAPEFPFPCGVEDSYAAVEWTKNNIAQYKGDPSKIFIGGDSSGGNFAAAVALMLRDRGGVKIKGQIAIFPAVIFEPDIPLKSEEKYGSGYFLEFKSGFDAFRFYYGDDLYNPYASPLAAESLKDLPPSLIASAGCDPLLDQALMYAARLKDEGNDMTYKIYEGVIHSFINKPMRQTFELFDEIGKFIKEKS